MVQNNVEVRKVVAARGVVFGHPDNHLAEVGERATRVALAVRVTEDVDACMGGSGERGGRHSIGLRAKISKNQQKSFRMRMGAKSASALRRPHHTARRVEAPSRPDHTARVAVAVAVAQRAATCVRNGPKMKYFYFYIFFDDEDETVAVHVWDRHDLVDCGHQRLLREARVGSGWGG